MVQKARRDIAELYQTFMVLVILTFGNFCKKYIAYKFNFKMPGRISRFYISNRFKDQASIEEFKPVGSELKHDAIRRQCETTEPLHITSGLEIKL